MHTEPKNKNYIRYYNNHITPKLLILLVFLFLFLNTGCLESIINTSTIYQSQPVKIRYDISYGYIINCTGTGPYEINYQCNIVEVLKGVVSSITLLYPHSYSDKHINGNHIIYWNITDTDQHTYTLGVNASVTSECYLINLDGEDALSINNIALLHHDLVEQYCRNQIANNIAYIDVTNPEIKNTARSIINQTSNNNANAFMIAQEIFKWLKTNTQYTTHEDKPNVQPAALTYTLKSGDCDDLSLLYISLCRSIGIPARFIKGYVIELKDDEVSAIPHAWVEVFVGGISQNGWIPVECAGSSSNIQMEMDQHFGVEDAFHLRSFVDTGSDESLELLLNDLSFTLTQSINITAEPFIKIKNLTILESKQLIITRDKHRMYK